MAQGWANNCQNREGDRTAPVGTPYSEIGQNMFFGEDGVDVVTAVDEWYDEERSYSYSDNTCADGQSCDAFTQVTDMGCELEKCDVLL